MFDEHYPGAGSCTTSAISMHGWRAARSTSNGNRAAVAAGTKQTKWLVEDPVAWTELWHAHRRRIEEDFDGRADDLLVIGVPAGEGWEKLAPFLDCPIPDVPFPRENQAPTLRRRLRRQAGRAVRAVRG